MEEENKNVNEETIIPNQNGEVEKDNSVPQEQKPKKSKSNIVVLILLCLMIVCALVYVFVLKPAYEKDNNKKNNNTTTEVLTNDEAIKIAKEKLELANTNNLFGYTCFDGKEQYSEEGYGSIFCYFGTLENFKNMFYSVYSTKLDYKDVLVEYMLPSGEGKTNLSYYDLVQGYAITDDKVYTNSCTIGVGSYSRMDKFTINSITSNTIEVNYVVMGNTFPENPEEGQEVEEGTAKMTLVKENGEWKILKATIVGMCNSTYEIGK